MMRRLPVTFALLALSGATALPAQRPQTLSQGPQMRRVFEPVVATARRSVVEVAVGDEVRCLGTAVAPELVLTKYSELHGAAADTSGETPASRPVWTCRRGKQQWICELVDFDQPSDLALLRAVGADLAPITWATDAPTPGAFLATPGPAETPLGIGILSTAPYVHTRPRAFLGVRFANPNGGPAELEEAVPHGAARAAGLLAKDVVIGVDDAEVGSAQDLREQLQRRKPGDKVKVKVRRDDADLLFEVTLGSDTTPPRSNQEGIWGPLSDVRSGFAEVLQHDTVLRPADCGGPVVDLSGKAVGLNIARAGRVETLALPAAAVQATLARLRAGTRESEPRK